ncbi:MAG: hypothetical protein KI790_15250 [Cyclobacteriaceae bacterium]|nr:hypothetical protein [Cyclobacteriaceae bacterium HetDA_MAG_MS6]
MKFSSLIVFILLSIASEAQIGDSISLDTFIPNASGITVSGGTISHDGTAAGARAASALFTPEGMDGKIYILKFNIISNNGTFWVRIGGTASQSKRVQITSGSGIQTIELEQEGSDKLIFSNTNGVTTETASVWSVDQIELFEKKPPLELCESIFCNNGNFGIGTEDTKNYRLAIAGKTITEEVKVALIENWPDFVFENNYNLRTLEQVEEHIAQKGHLPEIPSEAEVTENGINLGEMNAKLLQKIEELTLYLIEQNKEINELKQLSYQQQVEIEELQNKALK